MFPLSFILFSSLLCVRQIGKLKLAINISFVNARICSIKYKIILNLTDRRVLVMVGLLPFYN